MKIIPFIRPIYALLTVLLFVPLLLSAKKSPDTPYRIKTIVIDAGHGGQDSATHGGFSREKHVALATALRLGKAIEQNMKDVRVVYTRTADVFVPLYERIGIANRVKADLFISIHCNIAAYDKKVIVGYRKNKYGKKVPIYKNQTTFVRTTTGTETFVSGFGRLDEQDIALRENASILLEKDYKENYEGYDPKDPESIIMFSFLKNGFREQSIKLATFMQDEYSKSGRPDRGVKEKSLAVLARAGMPAVLTEIGFLSNEEEETYLSSESGQTEIVNALLKAIQSYKKQVEIE